MGDRRRFREGQTWFAQHPGKRIPMEDFLAEFGVRPEDLSRSSKVNAALSD